MNRQLEEVLEEVKALPDERQQEVAQVLLAFLDKQNPDLYLSPEQIAEIERCMSDDEPFATEEEVRSALARLTK
jgi:aryl-alcohol dehydrogenase-like predicted oxidoreductase